MIPKIIHYCWFGGNPKPDGVKKCIASWHKHCPDFEIKEWNESNFDIHCNKYCEQAYQQRKWAFVSDVARVNALVQEGGIYMDTDVEVVRPLDSLLSAKAYLGFEGTKHIATSMMGMEAHNLIMEEFAQTYNTRCFVREDGSLDKTTNVESLTRLLVEKYGLLLNGQKQKVGDFEIFPTDYFTPYDYLNGRLNKTDNTYSIHWFDQSWIQHKPLRTKLSQWYHRIIGIKME